MSDDKPVAYGEVNNKDIKKVYDIREYGRVTDADGKTWFIARAACGTTISAGTFKENFYEVVVAGPEENRKYSGDATSDAFKTFSNMSKLILNRSTSLS